MTQFASAHNDGYSAVLREAVETIRSRDHVNVLTPEGLREALTEPALYRQYKGLLSEGMSAESAAALDIFADNFQMSVFRESSLSGIQPVSVLTMPMLRKAWPKIGIKEALPTEPVKTPKFTVSHLMPYIKDPVTGVKKELPAALRDSALGTSQKSIDGSARALPMDSTDVMPVGCPVAAGYHLDPVFSVVAVDMEVADAAGQNVEAFSEAENALLDTVAKVLRKERINETEVHKLRDLGWKDNDILDACAQSTNMLGMSCLFETFSTPSAS